MKRILFIFSIILPIHLFAQYNIDSINHLILKTKDDTQLVNYYLEISNLYFGNNLDSSKCYLNLSERILQNINNDTLHLKFLNTYGNFYLTKGDNQKAKEYYDAGYKLANEQKNEEYLKRFTINNAKLAIKNGNYHQALKFYLEFESNIDTNNNFQKNILAKFYQNKSVCNTYLKKYNDAEKDIKKIILYAKNDSDSMYYYYAYTNLMILKNVKFETILPFFNNALKFVKKTKNLRLQIQLLTVTSESLYENGNYNEGLKYINEAIQLSRENNFDLEEMIAKYHQSLIYHLLKKNRIALSICKQITKYYKDNKDIHLLILSLDLQSDINESLKNYKEALENKKEANKLREKTTGEEQQKIAAELESQYDLNNKQKQIDAKIYENQLQKEKIVIEQKQKYFIFLLFSISIILLIWSLLNYSKKQKLNKELINQKFELQTKRDELDKTNKLKDKLFAMIGHDLRSPVTNILDQLTLWESEKQNEKSKLNKDSILKLKVNIVNLQLILSNLLQWASSQIISSTPNIQKINLKQITNGILGQLNENLKQKDIKIINYLENEEIQFDENQLNIILRNIISNSIKYSFNDNFIFISSIDSQNNVVLKIKDAGIGMSEEKIKNLFRFPNSEIGTMGEKGIGLGLSICKELIDKNNSIINIESNIGIGTTVTLVFPK